MTPEDRLNLHPHRAAASVWDRPGFVGPTRGDIGRYALALAGGMLSVRGLRRRSLVGAVITGAGVALLWNALAEDRRGAWKSFRGLTSRIRSRQQDPVHDASADSFPASDPPAWTPVKGTSTVTARAARSPVR